MWGSNNNGVKSQNVTYLDELVILSVNPYDKVGAALKSKDYYKSIPAVVDAFTENGTFNENKFEKFS